MSIELKDYKFPRKSGSHNSPLNKNIKRDGSNGFLSSFYHSSNQKVKDD